VVLLLVLLLMLLLALLLLLLLLLQLLLRRVQRAAQATDFFGELVDLAAMLFAQLMQYGCEAKL